MFREWAINKISGLRLSISVLAAVMFLGSAQAYALSASQQAAAAANAAADSARNSASTAAAQAAAQRAARP